MIQIIKQLLDDGTIVEKQITIVDTQNQFSGKYADLLDKPSLFSGNYSDLQGVPSFFSGKYSDLTGVPSFFSGKYSDLQGAPTIPVLPTKGTVNTQSGTTYTLASSDKDNLLKVTSNTTFNLTIPVDNTFADLDVISIMNYGGGVITVTPASGVTICSEGDRFKLATKNSVASLLRIGVNEWLLTGTLTK